jgi:F-type H+-transporting ATPase subunit a
VAATPKKRAGCLGCSFPILIGLGLTVFVLVVLGLVTGGIGTKVLHLNLPSWLTFERPPVELPAGIVFHVGGFPVTNTIIATWITMVFLVLFCWLITRRLREVPRRWQMVLEAGLGALMSFCDQVAGEKNGRKFFPIVATIFLFVAFNAWLALMPFFGGAFHATMVSGAKVELIRAANTDLNTPLALAIVSFVVVAYFGLRLTGRRYLKQFFNFSKLGGGIKAIFRGNLKGAFGGIFTGIIDAFIGFIELLSTFIRILSFTFRLFGNMTAGEILILMVTFLVPFAIVPIFYGLEMLVGLVQALIFAALTLVFMTLAVASHGEEH